MRLRPREAVALLGMVLFGPRPRLRWPGRGFRGAVVFLDDFCGIPLFLLCVDDLAVPASGALVAAAKGLWQGGGKARGDCGI